MKNFFKKITGLDKEEEKLVEEKSKLEEEKEELLKQTNPKEYATKKKEPYVAVIDTQVNKENIRNGFFELDWNDYFITELKKNGYGVEGDPAEEIVDRWFRDIVYQMLEDDGLDTSRGAGYINIVSRSDGKSEVS